MNGPGAFLLVPHVLACAFVAFMGLLVIGLGENRTAAEQADAKRAGTLLILVFVLALALALLLLPRRSSLAVLVWVLESGVGIVALLWGLENSEKSDEWVFLLAFGIGLTGLGALL